MKNLIKLMAPDKKTIAQALFEDTDEILKLFEKGGCIDVAFEDMSPLSIIIRDVDLAPLATRKLAKLIDDAMRGYEKDAYGKHALEDVANELSEIAAKLKRKADKIKVRTRADDPDGWYTDEEIAEMAKR